MTDGTEIPVREFGGSETDRPVEYREAKLRRRGELRLAISIPALMVLFTLVHGLTSIRILDSQWGNLTRIGGTEAAAHILRGHLYAIIILSIGAAATGLVLSLAILRPIRTIQQTAQRVAHGNLRLRVPMTGSAPEIGDLSRTFNSMIEFVNESIRERDRYLLEGMETGIMTADRTGRVTALNTAGAQILGLDSATVLGRSVAELRVSLPGSFEPVWTHLEKAIRDDQPRMLEEIVLRNGRAEASLLVATSPLRDGLGSPPGVLLNFRDAAEIKNLTDQLRKTDQLAAIGTFTMGLAHGLRNPLGAIKGIVQLLKLQGGATGENREYLDRVVREVNRLDSFVRELSEFCNDPPSASAEADLGDLLRMGDLQARGEAGRFSEKQVELIEDFSSEAVAIVEPDWLIRAFGNIIRNAYESVDFGGRITLSTYTFVEESGIQAIACVHNTGSTIEPADRSKIFNPFFTTREKGTGLGLSIAYQIIARQQGALEVCVDPSGVAFTAKFKVASPSVALAAPGAFRPSCSLR